MRLLSEDQIISNTVFKARATIAHPKNQVIWNRPPVVAGASEIAPAIHYLNQEALFYVRYKPNPIIIISLH